MTTPSPTIQPQAPEPGYEKGYAQEHLARLMRDAIGTETNHNVYIVAAGKILDRPEFMHVAHYARPTIEPVPVSERLPGAEDWVWHCYVGVRFWEHGRYNGRQFFIGDGPESQPATHWLPANALPTLEAANA